MYIEIEEKFKVISFGCRTAEPQAKTIDEQLFNSNIGVLIHTLTELL